MSRRNRAEEAQKAASEAGRILQSQRNFGDAVESVEPEIKNEESHAKPPTPDKNPRTIALEEIANARRPEVVESKEPEPEKKEPEASVTDEQKAEPKPEEQEQQPEAQATAPVLTRQKVDGKEYEVPLSEIEEAGGEKAWRINKAAQNRLEEAKAALAESRRTQAALAEFVQRSVVPQQQAPQSDDQFIASKIDTIRFGTPDESAAALKEILQRAAKPVDQNQITAHVLNEMQKTQAVEKFKTEFQDLLANPMVLRLAVALEQDRLPQLQRTNAPIDWETFYRTIGNEVRSAVGKSSQPAKVGSAVEAPVGNTSQTEKEARKASIVNLPAASTRATVKEDPKPETREDVLNDMRKRRGIPLG